MAFVQLFFNIFPALTSFGVGTGGVGEQKYFNHKQQQQEQQKLTNNSKNAPARGAAGNGDDKMSPLNNPYRGSYPHSDATGKKSQPAQQLASGSPPSSLPDRQELTPGAPAAAANEPMHHPDGGGTTTADYNELQFHGQLKQMLDLPILFAICFVQLISFVLVLNIEECSPVVLFSWWRNKIS
uniref:Uncharacterized protein n=1 Tax=Anopheles atroparvus TaxID=41427 RepID=A0A182JGK7_ANOAO